MLLAFSSTVLGDELIFSARVMGPVSNIYGVSADKALRKITENIRWRDIDADVSVQGTVVFSSNREADQSIDIHRRSESFDLYVTDGRGVITALTDTPQNEMLPRFSPDGTRVAFVRARRQLVLLELASRRERLLYEAGEILDFDWAPDGSAVAMAARDRQRGVILQLHCDADCLAGPLNPQVLKQYPRLHHSDAIQAVDDEVSDFGSVDHLRWSPGGKTLAFIFHPDGQAARSLHLLSLESGESTRISDESQQVQSPLSWSPDGHSLLYAALVNYRFYFDETAQKKVYQGAMQIFRSELNGKVQRLTDNTVAARAPVFVGENRIAYLQADQLAARQYALVVRDLDVGSERTVFDAVTPDSRLVVRR
ncbi:hypothetical protein GNX18_08320 [Microbulbifer sp. SH-1]|uniref:TolB family protein n=1 Tax=Microbulbifer sp. SH-1 TaxID=2681547 RepID=UPI00140E6E7E|nr:PD40 domain-containing protein [Microbulbifer sp. SH-1]QIL89756.1 hypothetical protein GNX18_08320 [Microbulbifer sp. SH-1]